MLPVVRRAAEAAADGQVGELDLRLRRAGTSPISRPLPTRVLEREPGGVRKLDVELAAVDVGHPGEAEPRDDEAARRRSMRAATAMTIARWLQRPVEPARIAVGDALEPVVEREGDAADRVRLRRCAAWCSPPCVAPCSTSGSAQTLESIGSSVKRHEQRHEHRERDRHAELEEDLADHAAHERDGDEHGDDGERRREHGEPDLVGALLRGAVVVFPHLQVAHDVLAHDDRVVDQQADRERQREQRHGVHGEVEHPHDEERRDDARPAA